ncbi:UAA transporter family [Fragilaria crotonensis]|nr:UAA transporter family [Fragilaria crotonensis]
MLSSWCQYEALRYVSFPATTLFKSFKLAPVMAMGKILGNKTYPTYDYFVALVIGVGITFFMSSSDDLKFGYDIYGEASATWTGVMLLFLYLFLIPSHRSGNLACFSVIVTCPWWSSCFATSAFSTVLAFVTLLHTKIDTSTLVHYQPPRNSFALFAFSICSTIGQIFIFYTIKNFGAVVFTLIMTTRILLSIAFSCILYGHEVTGVGFMGLMMVMGAVCTASSARRRVRKY